MADLRARGAAFSPSAYKPCTHAPVSV